ncbi:MAG: ubiquinone/menaquinone biosynthesis methyltransferase [archaeon GW2011_AR9]|nr:MAG: ubiquinone/menaquinone biosynthesis methyltransferase [archaeon GW2011_AR9]MBS3120390.1 class I SAM-dependent methyltransferase [Candidatus Woesearchaeota archaeon]
MIHSKREILSKGEIAPKREILSKEELQQLYRRRAKNYDVTANLYYAIGFREQAYRIKTVQALELRQGDTVLELCCGTGLNFSLLEAKIGPKGRIIGVDITDAMLEQAQERVKQQRWQNVELIQHDVNRYEIPAGIDGALSTFALTLVPEYDAVIEHTYHALRPGGKFALLDFKIPDNVLRHLAPLGAFLTRPFGVQLELTSRHAWESVEKYFPKSSMKEMYGGLTYLSVGEKGFGAREEP